MTDRSKSLHYIIANLSTMAEAIETGVWPDTEVYTSLDELYLACDPESVHTVLFGMCLKFIEALAIAEGIPMRQLISRYALQLAEGGYTD